MWALFGKFASTYGYRPWKGYDCTDYEPIGVIIYLLMLKSSAYFLPGVRTWWWVLLGSFRSRI